MAEVSLVFSNFLKDIRDLQLNSSLDETFLIVVRFD